MFHLQPRVCRGEHNAQAHGLPARHVQAGGGQTDQQETQRHGVRSSAQRGTSALRQGRQQAHQQEEERGGNGLWSWGRRCRLMLQRQPHLCTATRFGVMTVRSDAY